MIIMRKRDIKPLYKTVMKNPGNEIFGEFFRGFTDAEKVSLKCGYEVKEAKLRELKQKITDKMQKLDVRSKKILKNRSYPSVASSVKTYLRLWKEGYLDLKQSPKTYKKIHKKIKKNSKGEKIALFQTKKYTIKKANWYRGNLQPFFDYAYFEYNKEFRIKEKIYLEILFDSDIRAYVSKQCRDKDFIDVIKDVLIKYALNEWMLHEKALFSETIITQNESEEILNELKPENLHNIEFPSTSSEIEKAKELVDKMAKGIIAKRSKEIKAWEEYIEITKGKINSLKLKEDFMEKGSFERKLGHYEYELERCKDIPLLKSKIVYQLFSGKCFDAIPDSLFMNLCKVLLPNSILDFIRQKLLDHHLCLYSKRGNERGDLSVLDYEIKTAWEKYNFLESDKSDVMFDRNVENIIKLPEYSTRLQAQGNDDSLNTKPVKPSSESRRKP